MLRTRWFILTVIMIFMVTACGTNTAPSPTPEATVEVVQPTPLPTNAPLPAQISTETARIRIINAAADTPALNLTAGFLTIASNFSAGQSTQQIQLDGGETDFKIVASGSLSSDVPLLEKTLILTTGEPPTLLIVTGSGSQLDLLTVPEIVQPVNQGESVITVINATSDANEIKLQQAGQDLTTNIPFGQSAVTGILPVGETLLEFYSGTTKLLDYPTELNGQKAYTLILGGTLAQPIVSAFSVDAPALTNARTINASTELGSVDVYLDDTLLASAAEYGRPADRKSIISGPYTLSIYPTGEDRNATAPLATREIMVKNDSNVALILLGTAEAFEVVSYAEDLNPTSPSEARVAVLNTVSTFPSIHLEMGSGPIPGVSDMRYGGDPIILNLQGTSLNFYITGVDPNGVNNTVEVVENIQFEPGRSYLYLVTGRLDNNPIILSESVGIDENLLPGGEGTLEDDNDAQIRFVNAFADGQPVDFVVGDTTVASSIGYGQGSDLITIEHRNLTIGVRASGSSSNLASIDNLIESNERYTLIAYGTESAAQVLLLPDADLILNAGTPHLRFINLSASSDILLGVGFADASPTPVAEATANIGPEDDERDTIAFGVQRILENIAGGSKSDIILMPTGTFDIMILDSVQDLLAATVSGVTMESDTHYDIFAFQETTSPRVRTFAVIYPPLPE